jgi:hypothetical protein
MCLIAAVVFFGLAATSAGRGEWLLALLYGTIGAAFGALMLRNIRKTRAERKKNRLLA